MKVNKYDRQIRLWGHRGQKKLSEATVGLLGVDGAGIEAIKNLVLPGVGHIHVWGEGTVSIADLSSSFFFAPEDTGKSKAQALVENLVEMNPDDVVGRAFNASPSQLINSADRLKEYTLLIANNLQDDQNKALSSICYQLNIPVVFVTVVGFYIYIRNQKRIHFVESQNTTNKKYYMRLHDPFPHLAQHSQQWDIPQLVAELGQTESEERKKEIRNAVNYIPYPIVLLQAFRELPQGSRKKQHVVEKIKEWELSIGEDHSESFTQARGRTLDLYQTPDNFLLDEQIFNNPAVAEANTKSESVLLFLRACGQHLRTQGHLPQPTKLPDMHTSTQIYLRLKQVYKQQHLQDIAKIQANIREITGQESSIANEDISYMIDNLDCLQVIEFSKYQEQLNRVDNLSLPWLEEEWRQILLALRAQQIHRQQQKIAPKIGDTPQVLKIAESIASQYGFEGVKEKRYVEEVCRVEGQTTISISSIAGAIAGQEAIKLISGCFTPVKQGYVFSGVNGRGFSVGL